MKRFLAEDKLTILGPERGFALSNAFQNMTHLSQACSPIKKPMAVLPAGLYIIACITQSCHICL